MASFSPGHGILRTNFDLSKSNHALLGTLMYKTLCGMNYS